MIKKIFTIVTLAFCLNAGAQCTLTTSPDFTICAGGTVPLSATGATSYTWMPGGATTASVSITPSVTTIYTVTGTTGTCTATNTVAVTVNPTPTVSIAPLGGGGVICSGASAVITPSGASTYTINPGNNTGTSFVVTPTVSTTYTIDGSDGATGCINTLSNVGIVSIVVNPVPSAPVLAAPTGVNNASCTGSPPALTVNSGSNIAVWYSYNTVVHIGSNYTPPVSLPFGTYTYSVIDSSATPGGCISASESANTVTLSLVVSPGPSVTYTLVADPAPHTWDAYPADFGGTPPYNFVWNWGDGTNSAAAYPSHTYSVAGTYSICVTITDANGCSSTYCQDDAISRLGNNSTLSTMVYINVKSGTMGIEQIINSNELNIYPNPNNGSFVIGPNSAIKQTMQVYDVNGKVVLSQSINGRTSIDASSLNEGVYNISLQSTEGVVNKRLVIVK